MATGCVCRICSQEVNFLIKCGLGDWRCQECERKLVNVENFGRNRQKVPDPSYGDPMGCTALTMHAEALSDACFLEEVPIGII